MYIDRKTLEQNKNKQRLKEIGIFLVLIGFIALEYRSVHDLMVRFTHRMVLTRTNRINYETSGLGLWQSPTVQYQWKGKEYARAVDGMLIAHSSVIVPPVQILVDPENPQRSILKTPYGGWGAWLLDLLLLQAAFAGFIYLAFFSSYGIRRTSYFQ